MTGSGTGARLLHVGTVVADVVLGVPSLPPRGGDVLASAATVTAGGGFNVLAAAARQGMAAAYGGGHGTGPLGDVARGAMAGEGIEVLLPPTKGADTGFVITMVEPGGERTFVTSPGAEATLTSAALGEVTARPQDTVYVSGYALLHEATREALLTWLPALPAPTTLVFDPGPLGAQVPGDALDQVERLADWWTGNQEEAATATGETDPVDAAWELADRTGRDGVIVRLGPGGCLLAGPAARRTRPVRIPGYEVTAVDTTGAGDTHTGVFIAVLAAGAYPSAAARRANAAAAVSVTRRGPATAPTRAELTSFLAQSTERFFGGRPGAGRSG